MQDSVLSAVELLLQIMSNCHLYIRKLQGKEISPVLTDPKWEKLSVKKYWFKDEEELF